MSLPEIMPPAGTPVFQENGHSHDVRSVYRDVGMGTGAARRRRKTRLAPHVVSVSWFVDDAHVEAIEQWHESTLKAGSEAFAARVARIGARGLMWWSATWVGPLTYQPLSATQWRITGALLLDPVTGGSVAGPISTSARVEFEAALTASAHAVVTANAAVEFIAALETLSPAAVEFTAALTATAAGGIGGGADTRITSAGDTRVTSDGDTRITR